jgi:hypothetical protein
MAKISLNKPRYKHYGKEDTWSKPDQDQNKNQTLYQNELRKGGYSFYPTTDWWSPTFDDGTIAVSIIDYGIGTVKICINGGDDTMMALTNVTREEARKIVLKFPSIITMEYLRSIGFEFE